MTQRTFLIGVAIAVVAFVLGIQFADRVVETVTCYFHAINGNQLLSDRGEVWAACVQNHLCFLLC